MFADPHTAATAAPRRRWRFWLLLAGATVVLLVLATGVWIAGVNGRLDAAIAEADRLDPRWRLEEIEADRLTPPPGQNAAGRIQAVKRLTPARWLDPQQAWLFGDLSPEHQLNDQQVAALRELLGPVGPAVAEARSLIDTPRGRHPITFVPTWFGTQLPMVQAHREAADLLKYDVLDKAQAGDADGAVRSCHAAFHAGCSIGDEPFTISQVTRVAVQAIAVNLLERTLAQGEPSEAVLAALQARIEAEEPAPLLLYGLRGERAGGHALCENLRNGTVPITDVIGPLETLSLDNVRLRSPASVTLQEAWWLHHANQLVELAKLPPERRAGPFTDYLVRCDMSFRDGGPGRLAAALFCCTSSNSIVANACLRNHALLRCGIVAIAAERHRRRTGHWPATPDELVKAGLLTRVPGDPFAAGQPIKFARPGDGLVVYSVGEDGADDGGKLDKAPTKPGTDYGFRLWDVTARRQPPLPPKPVGGDANGPPGAP